MSYKDRRSERQRNPRPMDRLWENTGITIGQRKVYLACPDVLLLASGSDGGMVPVARVTDHIISMRRFVSAVKGFSGKAEAPG